MRAAVDSKRAYPKQARFALGEYGGAVWSPQAVIYVPDTYADLNFRPIILTRACRRAADSSDRTIGTLSIDSITPRRSGPTTSAADHAGSSDRRRDETVPAGRDAPPRQHPCRGHYEIGLRRWLAHRCCGRQPRAQPAVAGARLRGAAARRRNWEAIPAGGARHHRPARHLITADRRHPAAEQISPKTLVPGTVIRAVVRVRRRMSLVHHDEADLRLDPQASACWWTADRNRRARYGQPAGQRGSPMAARSRRPRSADGQRHRERDGPGIGTPPTDRRTCSSVSTRATDDRNTALASAGAVHRHRSSRRTADRG